MLCVPLPREELGSFPGEEKSIKLNRKNTARTEIMGDERFAGIENELKAYRSLSARCWMGE